MSTYSADVDTAKATVTWLSSQKHFLSLFIEWVKERRLRCTKSCGIRWLFFLVPRQYDPTLQSVLPRCSYNWSACKLLPSVGLPGRVRETILCNLRLVMTLRSMVVNSHSHSPHPLSHSHNLAAVSGLRVILWAGRGHFVTAMKSGGKEREQPRPINVFYGIAGRHSHGAMLLILASPDSGTTFCQAGLKWPGLSACIVNVSKYSPHNTVRNKCKKFVKAFRAKSIS